VSLEQPTAIDEAMMERVLAEARAAIADGKVGVAALIVWRDEVLALNHCLYQETGDHTAHAEMVVLREAAQRLNAMNQQDKAQLTLYTTLEPCLMCLAAISFVEIPRVVYAALAEDSDGEGLIAHGVTTNTINPRLVRGPLRLVPGVKREQGKALLALMGKSSCKDC